MRISRKLSLPQSGGLTHTIWNSHNKSYLLQAPWAKNLFLLSTAKALEHKSVNKQVGLQAFCLMDNHSHQLLSYKSSSDALSSFMRIAHGAFGLQFNRFEKRKGSVGYDRPKTPLVQKNSSFHNMRVHFYIEANPLRAKMVKNVSELKRYVYSSYRFYAWGIKDNLNSILEIPEWYLKLGKTAKQRQAKYRSLFDKYLKDFIKNYSDFVNTFFIGDSLWIEIQRLHLKNATIAKNHNPSANSPPPPG